MKNTTPRRLSICHLQQLIESTTTRTMAQSVATCIGRLGEKIFTTLPGLMIVESSQGTGSPKLISNTFEPTDEDSAMSPNPFRATSTDVMASGTDVPAARTVTPITGMGSPISKHISSAANTIRKVSNVIHASAAAMVTPYKNLKLSMRQSGTVKAKLYSSGAKKMNLAMLPGVLSGRSGQQEVRSSSSSPLSLEAAASSTLGGFSTLPSDVDHASLTLAAGPGAATSLTRSVQLGSSGSAPPFSSGTTCRVLAPLDLLDLSASSSFPELDQRKCLASKLIAKFLIFSLKYMMMT
mmetsp:Transcript_39788/g.65961  ORF Transcript_39788/g.65961 Transcript_39788/m.65961 type:complete len:295 (-) Transcript_39788:764-1648(-)